MNLYGIKSNSLKWFSSYLSNKKKFIQAGAIKTSNLDIICGVPQGSILGPLNYSFIGKRNKIFLKFLK